MRLPEKRITKLIMEWIPQERRKRRHPKKTWIEAAMTTRNLEPDQWRNREEWCLVSGRQRQLLKILDRQMRLANLPFSVFQTKIKQQQKVYF
jgi:hypothetical protein